MSIKTIVPRHQKDKEDDGGGSKPRNTEVDFHGQRRSNTTHASRIDPDARLFRKGRRQPARLCHGADAIAENRHGLAMAVALTH